SERRHPPRCTGGPFETAPHQSHWSFCSAETPVVAVTPNSCSSRSRSVEGVGLDLLVRRAVSSLRSWLGELARTSSGVSFGLALAASLQPLQSCRTASDRVLAIARFLPCPAEDAVNGRVVGHHPTVGALVDSLPKPMV